MESSDPSQQRLDQIVTQWTLFKLSHEGASYDSEAARQAMLLKYSNAIRAYVGALLQNDEDADEVSQDVLVRMLRGDFANANPEKGRFRDFLKVAVKNMVRTHWSRKKRRSGVDWDVAEIGQTAEESESDEAVDTTWQTLMLESAMRALKRFEQQNAGCVYYQVMNLRTKFPDVDSNELADRLAEATGKSWNAAAARQQLRRARLRFAQLLIEKIAAALRTPSPDEIEAELIDLGLMPYVKPFLPDDWSNSGRLVDESDDD